MAALLTSALVAISCKSGMKSTSETQNKEVDSEWIILFDGTSTKGWRAIIWMFYLLDGLISQGALTFDTQLGLEQDYKGGKGIMYGAEEFENFELYLEWKIPEGGNSGIFIQ